MSLFGTDGIRGRAGTPPLTDEGVRRLGNVVGHLLRRGTCSFRKTLPGWFQEKHPSAHNNIFGKGRVLIGRDPRVSGTEIEKALVRGLSDFNVETLLAGVLPTPGVAMLTRRWGCALGIMISASHNPAQDNGIKVFSPEGVKIPDEAEAAIEALFLDEGFQPRLRHSRTRRTSEPADAGERSEEYLDFLRDMAGKNGLGKGKVVVDCANGAASTWAPLLMGGMGLEVEALHCEPDGLNINRDCGALHVDRLRDRVVKNGAMFGAALDGDADRVLFVDEKGSVVDGDHVLAMHALDLHERGNLPGKTVVGTLMTNHGLQVMLESKGIRLIRTNVGDRHVFEAMLEGEYRLGGETSGHTLFLDHAAAGDGMVTLLQTLLLMRRTGRSLAALASVFKPFPQLIVNVPVSEKPDLDRSAPVRKAREKAEAVLGDAGRVVLRYSGTEPLCRVMTEGPDPDLVKEAARSLAETIRTSIGSDGAGKEESA